MASTSTVFDDDGLRVSVQFGTQRSAVLVVFSGAALLFGGTPQEEFFRSTQGLEVTRVFVVDKTISFYSRLAHNQKILAEIQKVLRPLEPARVVTIGVSAGGLGAVIFAKLLNAQACIAFSPQFTVHAHRLGGPPIYKPASLDPVLDVDDAGAFVFSKCRYSIITGNVGADIIHASHIGAAADGFASIQIADHRVANFVITARGFLPLIESAFAAESPPKREYVGILRRCLPTAFIDPIACRQMVRMIKSMPNLAETWDSLEPQRAAWAVGAINDWLLRDKEAEWKWREQYAKIAAVMLAGWQFG